MGKIAEANRLENFKGLIPMNDEFNRAATRGRVRTDGRPAPVDLDEAAAQDRGQSHSDDMPDDTGPDLPDEPKDPGKPPASQNERDAHTLMQKASEVIDKATVAIVDNIGALIERAERLRNTLTADTAAAKERVNANLNLGARILDLSKTMNSQLDEIENIHRQRTRGE